MELPLTIIFSLLFLSGHFGAKLPSNFKRCSSKDTACLKNAIQDALPKLKDGIPELGVPSLDPIYVSKFEVAASPKVVNLSQKYKNVEFRGLSSAKIENLMLDLNKRKMKLDFTAPSIEWNATFEADGQLLAFTVQGTGKASLHLAKVVANLDVDLEIMNEGNEKYIKGKRGHLIMDVENCKFVFLNSGGDDQLWKNINIVLNENWRIVYDDIISGYAENYASWMMDIMNKLFATIPMSEIFTD